MTKGKEESHNYKKVLWTQEEDNILVDYVKVHGEGQWNRVAKTTGLKRCGKSCRLRWINYLSPNVNHGSFTEDEEALIIRLHNLLGNRWSLIAKRVPGRTDNQVKNYWNTHLSKKLAPREPSSRFHIKEQTSRTGVSSSTVVPQYAINSSDKTNANTDNTVDKGTQKLAIAAPQAQEMAVNHTDMNFFWAVANDDAELSALIPEFDWYSFDFV